MFEYYININLFAGMRPSLEDVEVREKYQHIKSLIELCWHTDPKKRCKMNRIAFILNIDPEFYGQNIEEQRPLPPISNAEFY